MIELFKLFNHLFVGFVYLLICRIVTAKALAVTSPHDRQ